MVDTVIVETDTVEWAVHEVREFCSEIVKSRESECIDPAGAGLVPWKYSFIDDGDGVPHFCQRGGRGRATGPGSHDQDIHSLFDLRHRSSIAMRIFSAGPYPLERFRVTISV